MEIGHVQSNHSSFVPFHFMIEKVQVEENPYITI